MSWDFKKEEDVKQFLDNLGIEYRFGCYSEKKPEVCHLLGDYLESVKKDFAKAAKLYKTNCDDYKFGRSCHKYGGYSFMGKGCPENQQLGLEYFKKGCLLGEKDSCLNAGLLNITSDEKIKVTRNFSEGFGFLKQSCETGNAYGCFYLSGMYLTGVPNHLEKDMLKAFECSKKSCELNNMYACANLSQMYAKGDGVEKNPDMAEKYKQKAIDLQSQVQARRTIEFQQGT